MPTSRRAPGRRSRSLAARPTGPGTAGTPQRPVRVAGQGACGAGAAHACTHGQHVSWPRGVGNPTLTRPGRLRADLQHPVRAAGDGGCVPGATRAHGGRAARGRPLHPLPHRLARAGALPDRALARQPLLRRRGCGRPGAAVTRPCARMRASCVSRLRLDGEGARRGRPWRAPIPPHACGRFVPRLWLERV